MQSFRGSGARASVLVALVLALAACSAPSGWTQTPFAREASDAGSTLSAAAELLEAAHTGRLTNRYVRGAFVNLSEQVEGVDSKLPTLEGRPDDATVASLAAGVRAAQPVLASPCVDTGCDWHAQVDTLRSTADKLSKAAEA